MMSDIQRREFLSGAAGFAAAATATLAGTARAAGASVGDEPPPQPVRGDKGAPIIGPSNPSRQAQSPDRINPPATDSGTLPTLRWSFTDSHIKMREGGWSRQTTIREIPSSTDLALVNMRLKAGGVRELHWHKPAEWAFMLKGRARITAIDEQGRTFQDDVGEGDLWNFPSGIPHSIQGLEGDGCEFLLVFDDGNFSEDSTFSVTDWLAHTPREVLAKNFGVPEAAFAGIPEKELFIFQSTIPGPLAADKVAGAGALPSPFSYRLLAQEPIRTTGGTVRISESTNFPVATTISAAFVEVEPGAMREMHWHPNANEAQYYISGQARMTVFAADSTAGTFDYQPGDVGFVPRNMGHYIENTGTTKLQFLELWRTDKFADVSLRQWLAFTPYDLVHANVKIDKSVLAKIPTHKTPIVPA
jgi:oxalate decarboxylase